MSEFQYIYSEINRIKMELARLADFVDDLARPKGESSPSYPPPIQEPQEALSPTSDPRPGEGPDL